MASAYRLLVCGLWACSGSGGPGADPSKSTETALPVDSGVPGADCPAPSLAVVQSWDKAALPNRTTDEQRRPGVGVGDIDGDGDLDVIFAYGGGSMGLRNDGTGTLSEDPHITMDGAALPGASAVALGDLDGDGDLDAYLGRQWETPDVVLVNDGTGAFVSVELEGSEAGPAGGALGDLDGDGDLDLVVGRLQESPDPSAIVAGTETGHGVDLYRNDGGSFVLANDRLPASVQTAMVWEVEVLDVDSDGDLDLYLANDFGGWLVPNQLLLNDGTGAFTVDEDCFCDLAMYAMGSAVGDVDDDLRPDLYITDIGGPNLFVNDGAGAFYDGTLALGADVPPTERRMSSWGVQFADVDLDADLDLLAMFGRLGQHSEFVGEVVDPSWTDGDAQDDVLLLREGDVGYRIADEVGFTDPERGRTVATADLDGDGRPEVITAGKHFLKVWALTGGCDTGLTVALDDPDGAPHGIGARVTVTVAGRRATQWMVPATTGGSAPHELYFGLAGAAAADAVEVGWLDGRTTVVDGGAAGTRLVVSPD